MSVWKFFAIKAAALVVALVVIGVTWFVAPEVLIAGFDANLVWIGELWGFIYPHLPLEASVPLDAVEKAHAAIVTVVQTVAKLLPEETAPRVEAATRAALGEGWILLAQIALPLRIYWIMRWR